MASTVVSVVNGIALGKSTDLIWTLNHNGKPFNPKAARSFFILATNPSRNSRLDSSDVVPHYLRTLHLCGDRVSAVEAPDELVYFFVELLSIFITY
jgi:hypothetical protein